MVGKGRGGVQVVVVCAAGACSELKVNRVLTKARVSLQNAIIMHLSSPAQTSSMHF